MLGSKGLLTPLIPDCSALRALTILKNIRNPLIFLRKMASYSCFWRVPRLKILMQASLHQISNLLTLVSCHLVNSAIDLTEARRTRPERTMSGLVRKLAESSPPPHTAAIFPRDERLIYTPYQPVRWPYRRRPHLLNEMT